jgi:NADPH:quinone reductase-like Zn-dependent oxidoreductase
MSTAEQQASAHSAIRAGLESGTLRSFIQKIRPISEARIAHDEIVDAAGGLRGKIVLKP